MSSFVVGFPNDHETTQRRWAVCFVKWGGKVGETVVERVSSGRKCNVLFCCLDERGKSISFGAALWLIEGIIGIFAFFLRWGRLGLAATATAMTGWKRSST